MARERQNPADVYSEAFHVPQLDGVEMIHYSINDTVVK
jgi:hypothetical protein